MPEFDIIKPWDLEKITKGKIGEWIARSYYRSKGYVVWFLEAYYHGSFYSGTGKEYVNDRIVLTPLEKAILENFRTFDLLVVPKEDVKFIKGELLNIHHYNLLKDLFTVVIKEEGLDGLEEYLNLDIYRKIKFVKSKAEDIMSDKNKRNVGGSTYYRQQFKSRIYDIQRWFEFFRKPTKNSTEEALKEALIEMENRHNTLKRLKRLLVDIKTKWSEYDYPERSVIKCKVRLTKLLKSLGFKCGALEINFICPEIKLKSIML